VTTIGTIEGTLNNDDFSSAWSPGRVYHKAAYACLWRARAHAHDGGLIERFDTRV
jgi:hypothetical protein